MPTLLAWEDVQTGVETGTVDFTVTDAMVDEFLVAMDYDNPLFATGTPRIAPPDLVPKLTKDDLFVRYVEAEIGKTVGAKHGFKSFRPVTVGMRVCGTGRLVEKYERRGRRFVVFEALLTEYAGEPLVLYGCTMLVLQPDFRMQP